MHELAVELALALIACIWGCLAQGVAPHELASVKPVDVHECLTSVHLEDEHATLCVPVDLVNVGDRPDVTHDRRDAEMPLASGGAVQRVMQGVPGPLPSSPCVIAAAGSYPPSFSVEAKS